MLTDRSLWKQQLLVEKIISNHSEWSRILKLLKLLQMLKLFTFMLYIQYITLVSSVTHFIQCLILSWMILSFTWSAVCSNSKLYSSTSSQTRYHGLWTGPLKLCNSGLLILYGIAQLAYWPSYKLGNWIIRVWFVAGKRGSLFFQASTLILWHIPASCEMPTEESLCMGKEAKVWGSSLPSI